MFRSFLKRHFWLILTIILTIPAFIWFLKPGQYYNMHDDMQVIRQLQLEKCLIDGQIPCRWSPDLGYGYGYPLFNFYPPLPYIVGQVFRTLGFSFIATVKLAAIAQILFSSLAMYLLASSIFGPLGGSLAALFLTYAPYHAVNIYVRGAMNEAWASVFFPLIFYFSMLLIQKDKKIFGILGLGLSFTGLLLSHNPMALTFVSFLSVWIIYWLLTNPKNKIKKSVKSLLISGLLVIGLSSFYTLPVLFETKYVQINNMFENYYHYSVHFVSYFQLFFSNFWGDGSSVWGTEDKMSFMIGYLHWIIPLLTSIYFALHFIKKKKLTKLQYLTLILILLGFFSAFMTHQKSLLIWTVISPIQKVQFPWRFLNHTVFLLSLSVAYLAVFIKKMSIIKKQLFYSFTIVILFLLNLNYFHPLVQGPITDEQKFSGQAWTNLVTSGITDYLPKTSPKAPQSAANFVVDEISPVNSAQVSGLKKGTDWLFFNANVIDKSTITIAQIYYPGFQITDNNKTIKFKTDPEYGRMQIELSPGYHQIYVKLQNTPIRLISNYISFLTWLSLLIFLTYQLYGKIHQRRRN